MECYKSGTEVDMDKIDSSDADWYRRYIEQNEVGSMVHDDLLIVLKVISQSPLQLC